jgi:hypothetical protein
MSKDLLKSDAVATESSEELAVFYLKKNKIYYFCDFFA